MLAGHVDDLLTPLDIHGHSGRVLEVGDGVDELGFLAHGAEGGHYGLCLLVIADTHGTSLIGPDGLKRAQVRGQTAENGVAGVDENPGNQVKCLLGSGGDEDILYIHLHTFLLVLLGYLLSQGHAALCRTVLENLCGLLVHQLVHDLLEVVHGESDCVGETTAERNDFRPVGHVQEVADSGPSHALGIVGKVIDNIKCHS